MDVRAIVHPVPVLQVWDTVVTRNREIGLVQSHLDFLHDE
jgi:hypothetical protein